MILAIWFGPYGATPHPRVQEQLAEFFQTRKYHTVSYGYYNGFFLYLQKQGRDQTEVIIINSTRLQNKLYSSRLQQNLSIP